MYWRRERRGAGKGEWGEEGEGVVTEVGKGRKGSRREEDEKGKGRGVG